MALKKEEAISCELVDVGTQKGGKYRLRKTFYTFQCSTCLSGILRIMQSDLKKVSGKCRKCANKDGAAKTATKLRKRPYEALYNKFKYDRKRFGQFTDLSYEDFLEFTCTRECHYCGAPVSWTEFGLSNNGSRYNLDRTDNSRRYVKENLVVCCWKCNETKSDRFTYKEFMLLAPALRRIQEVRNDKA